MVYELEDTSLVSDLFAGWKETLIYSCLQKVMGRIYVTDLHQPASAFAFVGCFGFFAGVPDRELVMSKPAGFTILTPPDDEWADLITDCFPDSRKVVRYAIRKDTRFDTDALWKKVAGLPAGYEIHEIDEEYYDRCVNDPLSEDFVSAFGSREEYLRLGRGFVITKDGEIVSGASSYTRYNEGIEIEVDTAEPERRKGLATVACAALILKCLGEKLYPSWDAQNRVSVHLAESLGYELDHEYFAFEVV